MKQTDLKKKLKDCAKEDEKVNNCCNSEVISLVSLVLHIVLKHETPSHPKTSDREAERKEGDVEEVVFVLIVITRRLLILLLTMMRRRFIIIGLVCLAIDWDKIIAIYHLVAEWTWPFFLGERFVEAGPAEDVATGRNNR